MDSQAPVCLSLLLCAFVIGYVAWRYQVAQKQRSRGGEPLAIPLGLHIVSSVQASPGVKVHLLRWRSADAHQHGEFVLVTSAQTTQITACNSIMLPHDSYDYANTPTKTSAAHA